MKSPQQHPQADQTHSAAPPTSQPRQAQQPSSAATALAHSPRMTTQRNAIRAAFGPVAAPAQLQVDAGQELSEEVSTPAVATQRAAAGEDAPNLTGIPNPLKSGIEALSSMDMSDVRVHRNSDRPAQLSALAYAQGNDIHLGPGQERHLAHEAWHVAQQRQGRVKETMQMAGMGVNDDAGLEKEADVMGAKASGFTSKFVNAARTEQPFRGVIRSPVQRAGHAEDLCVLKNWIVKRADKTEIAQYTTGATPPTAPNFSGPYYTANEVREFLNLQGEVIPPEKDEKIDEMAEPMAKGGKGFLILANATAGMPAPKMRDLKMGRATADDADQERHGVTGVNKAGKMKRHQLMDKVSGSQERGYRDEDQWKVKWTGDNLEQLKLMLDNASYNALNGMHNDLLLLHAWLQDTKVVYVGMSVLVVTGGDTGKAVAIDFEHPINANENSFDEHKDGLIHGAVNLCKLVNEYIVDYLDRLKKKEDLRQALAQRDYRHRYGIIVAGGGSINNTEEGNMGIGDYDL